MQVTGCGENSDGEMKGYKCAVDGSGENSKKTEKLRYRIRLLRRLREPAGEDIARPLIDRNKGERRRNIIETIR